MATIRIRPSGSWQAVIRRQGYPDQSTAFERRGDVEAWVRDIEGQMDRGPFVSRSDAESTTLREALARYLQEVTPKKRGADVRPTGSAR